MQQKTNSFKENFSKNTFYRFLNSAKTNWLRFTTQLAKLISDKIEPLTDDRIDQKNISSGIKADYVLFDTWFSAPAQLIQIRQLGLNAIAMIKKSPNVHYLYKGKRLSINQIFDISKKRRGKSKYLISVNVRIEKDVVLIPAKIVCVRNKKNKKDWITLICTNTKFSYLLFNCKRVEARSNS